MTRRRKEALTPLEEHLAWIFLNRGLRSALRNEEERNAKDFSEAPIKRWYDARYGQRRRKVDAR